MYLSRLNREEQKNFLELAYSAANYNDDFAKEQKDLINKYRNEMVLDNDEYQIQEKELNDILDFFAGSTKEIKNIVFLEIITLILSDQIYSDFEKEIVAIIEEGLEIADGKHDQAVELVMDMQKLYGRAEAFVRS